jgi:hypothetical protein
VVCDNGYPEFKVHSQKRFAPAHLAALIVHPNHALESILLSCLILTQFHPLQRQQFWLARQTGGIGALCGGTQPHHFGANTLTSIQHFRRRKKCWMSPLNPTNYVLVSAMLKRESNLDKFWIWRWPEKSM